MKSHLRLDMLADSQRCPGRVDEGDEGDGDDEIDARP